MSQPDKKIIDKYIFPASKGQEQLWFLSQVDEKLSAAYNISTYFKIEEHLNYLALQKSINYLVKRHESLRTGLMMIDSELCQVIEPNLIVTLKCYDFSKIPDSQFNQELEMTLQVNAAQSFDLSEAGLLRCSIIRRNDYEYYLLVVMHHAISDGISMEIFINELQYAYAAYSNKQIPTLPDIEFQFVDIISSNAFQEKQNGKAAIVYWKKELHDFLPKLTFQKINRKDNSDTFDGESTQFTLDAQTLSTISNYARSKNYSSYVFFLSAYALLVHYYTGNLDFVIGVPTANRQQEEEKKAMGFFANTLLIRVVIDHSMTLNDLLCQLNQKIRDGLSHETLPYMSVVSSVFADRNIDYDSIFRVMFGYQERLNIKDNNQLFKIKQKFIGTGSAKFDLSFFVVQDDYEFNCFVEYRKNCFNSEKIQQLVDHYIHLCRNICEIDLNLLDIKLITQKYSHEIKANLNNYIQYQPESINNNVIEVDRKNNRSISDTEKKLINIIKTILDTSNPISVEINLFEIGANSIMIAKIANIITDQFGVNISIRNIFKDPTIENIAKKIDELNQHIIKNFSTSKDLFCLTQSEINSILQDILEAEDFNNSDILANIKIAQNKLEHLFSQNRSNVTQEQQRLLFLKKLDPKYPIHEVCYYEFLGDIDIEKLQIAISNVITDTQFFFYRFLEIAGRMVKVINKSNDINIKLLSDNQDLTQLEPEYFDSVLDPIKGNLIKFLILPNGNQRCCLIVIASKLVVDKDSLNILTHSIAECYAENDNISSKHFLDLDVNMNLLLERQAINNKTSQDYWCQHLNGITDTTILEDFQRSEIKSHNQASVSMVVENGLFNKVKEFALSNGATVNQVLKTAFLVLIHRYVQHEDICIGINHNLRSLINNFNQIGAFETVLPCRVSIREDETFISLMNSVKDLDHIEREHIAIPFKHIVENLGIKRDLQKTPLFQIAYSFQDIPNSIYKGNSFAVNVLPLSIGYSEVDIQLNIASINEICHFRIDYNRDIYTKKLINNLLGNLITLVDSLLENPNQSCQKARMITHREQDELLHLLSVTTIKRDDSLRLHHLFVKQAQLVPDNIAVICESNSITYKMLDMQSNKLANAIVEKQIKNDIIAIVLNRSIDTVIAIMAVLKSGNAYMAVDPEYPIDRITWMLSDSDCAMIISHSHYEDIFDDHQKQKLFLIDKINIDHYSIAMQQVVIKQDDIAYVIYTSGTTGKPKATLLAHEGIVNNILWRQETWPLNSNDRILMNSSFSFDPSVWGVFWPLAIGGSTIITASNIKNDINEIIKLMIHENISVIGTVPSFITLLMEHPKISECRNLRYVLSGGEVLSKSLQKKILDVTAATVVNIFGPTETTIDASYYVCKPNDNYRVAPIGRPVTNLKIYVLDKFFIPVPQGVKGEIYVGGVGLAKGYYHQEELTQAKFIFDPYSNIKTDKLYRTEDIGRINSDALLEYIGRADRQVKVRGYRIELSEIERVIKQHPAVLEAAVLENFINNDCILNAYISLVDNETLDEGKLRSYLTAKLPNYMIPNNYLIGIVLPKNANDKIDYKKLIPIKPKNTINNTTSYTPVDPIEKIVAEYFCDALSIQKINNNADFFELGGTSFMLTRLASNLYKHFELDIPLYQFFKVPTIFAVTHIIKSFKESNLLDFSNSNISYELESDAILDDDIYPLTNLEEDNYQNPSSIFLTGATGYLGTFLLDEIIKQTKAIVYCLVRAKTIYEGFERIKASMQRYRVWNDIYQHRIKVVVGDLAQEKLGLSDHDWNELCKEVDIIYHNGAVVNFAYPYSALRDANVKGTKEILRLACKSKLKSVNYVSTIDILLAAHCTRLFLEDDTPIKKIPKIPGGYTGTKWVAEKLVHTANARGIPTIIYRPSLVMGHSTTGATQLNDYLLVSFKGFIPMGIMPEYPRIFDVVPVDYVAKSMVHISMQQDIFGKFFHLFNPNPSTLSNFLELTQKFGYRFDIVPFNEAKSKALEVDSDHPLYPLIPLFRDANPTPQRSLDPNYISEINPILECKNTFEKLQGSNIQCPAFDENLVHLCMRYLVDVGFLPEPIQVLESDTCLT